MSWLVGTCVAKNTPFGSRGRILIIARLLRTNPPPFLYFLGAKIHAELPLATIGFTESAGIAM